MPVVEDMLAFKKVPPAKVWASLSMRLRMRAKEGGHLGRNLQIEVHKASVNGNVDGIKPGGEQSRTAEENHVRIPI